MTPIRTIFKNTWQLALAMSLSRLLNTITSFVGILMIGHLGTTSLAASALMTSTQLTLVIVAMSLLFAVGVMTSRSFGAQKFQQIGAIFQQGLLIATLVSIPVMLIMAEIQPILEFFGQNIALTAIDQSYFDIYLWLMPPMMWAVCMQQSLLAVKKQQFVLIMSVFGLMVSIGCGYWFIYGGWGVPAMGIPGLGLAYAIQVWLSFLIYAAYCSFNASLKVYGFFRWRLGSHWHLLKQLLSIGWPICLQTGSDLVSFSAVMLMVGWLGTTALAAQQISTQFFILLVVPIFAVAQASGILIGRARGAKDLLDVKRYGNMSLLIGVGFCVIIMALFVFLPHQLVNLYEGANSNANSTLEHLAVTVLMLTGIRLIFDASAEIYAGSLRGLYDTKFPMLALTSITWIIGMPLAYVFGFTFNWGLVGLTSAGIIVMLLNTSVLHLRWRYQCRKLAANAITAAAPT